MSSYVFVYTLVCSQKVSITQPVVMCMDVLCVSVHLNSFVNAFALVYSLLDPSSLWRGGWGVETDSE